LHSPEDSNRDAILAAWRTNNRVTLFLFEHLPAGLWSATIPRGAPWSQRAAEANPIRKRESSHDP
jgi:hypothetical protein